MKEIIYSILPNIINDAASGNRLLYITDEFNENIVSVAEATDMTVFCEDLDLLSKYRRLFKNCKGVIFARSKEELNKDYETVTFFCSSGSLDDFSEITTGAKRIIIPGDKVSAVAKCLSQFENKVIYNLSMKGSFAELAISEDTTVESVAVYYNGESVTRDIYSISTVVPESIGKAKGFMQDDSQEGYSLAYMRKMYYVYRARNALKLLFGPIVLIAKIIVMAVMHFKPTKLFIKCLKALKEGGFSTLKSRIRTYKGIKDVNDLGCEFNFDQTKQYVDYDSEYQDNIDFTGNTTDVKMLAYYLPQFHSFKENDEWWGKGFTEWNNTRVAEPRFAGHYQPREPHEDIGYYDLSDIETMRKQVELAKQHGIYGFCFYYYWFSGKRLMEKPVDMLLEHPEIDFPFCLCWANENWTRAWDGQTKNVLIAQNYSDSDDERFMVDMKKYIDDKRYIRINGKPLVVVYNPGEIPDCRKSFNKWREVARKIGIGEILIWTCRTANNTATLLNIEDCIDSEVEFPPHNTWLEDFAMRGINLSGKSASIFNYQKLVEGWTQLYKNGSDKNSKKAIHRGCMMAWDNAARRKNNWFTYYHFSLKSLYEWVLLICAQARRDFAPEERFVFINAWNEWAEGTYLEPDKKYGYANINTVSKALYSIPWENDLDFIDNNDKPLEAEQFNKKIAVNVHMFYTEILDETIENLNEMPYDFDCYFTTNTEEKAEIIRTRVAENCKCAKCVVDVCENRGRDVAPFIMQMRDVIDEYDYICHIHSKRTVTADHGNDWRRYIFKNMFGSKEYLKRLFHVFEQNADIGIIFPETFAPLEYQACWGGNLEGCGSLFNAMGLNFNPPQNVVFPVGNMFWAKTQAVRAMFKFPLELTYFPEEDHQVNITLAHCIERSWVLVAKEYGFTYRKLMNNCIAQQPADKLNRAAFYVHFNANGEFSDQDYESLKCYDKVFKKIIFVSNSPLKAEDRKKIEAITDFVFERENKGYDFAAWKYGIEKFGYENLEDFDAIALINNSTFAPIYDMKNVIREMDERGDDFWGMTLFPYIPDGSYVGRKFIPEHLQSYFLMLGKKVIKSGEIKNFFDNLGEINSFTEAVSKGEIAFNEHLQNCGFTYSAYIEETRYLSAYLGTMAVPYDKPTSLLLLGCPLIKKKAYNYMLPYERIRLESLFEKLK